MKRLAIIAIISLCFGISSYGQWYFSGGLHGGTVSHKTFKQFAQAYNDFESQNVNITKELTDFDFCYGYGYGSMLTSEWLLMELSYSKIHSGTEVLFENGIGRRFELSYSALGAIMGYGATDENGGIWGYVGYHIGTVKIKSKAIYMDGSESLGLEKYLNGIYQTFSVKANIGVRYMQSISERFFLSFDLSWMGRGFMVGMDELRDKSKYSYRTTDRLPIDYKEYWEGTDPYLDQDANCVKHDVRGIRLGISLAFRLSDFD